MFAKVLGDLNNYPVLPLSLSVRSFICEVLQLNDWFVMVKLFVGANGSISSILRLNFLLVLLGESLS